MSIKDRAKHVLRDNQHQQDVLKKKWRDGEITKEDYMRRLSLLRAEAGGIRKIFR